LTEKYSIKNARTLTTNEYKQLNQERLIDDMSQLENIEALEKRLWGSADTGPPINSSALILLEFFA